MAVFAYRYAVQLLSVKTWIPQLVMALHLGTAVSCDAKSFNIFCDILFQFIAAKAWNWYLTQKVSCLRISLVV